MSADAQAEAPKRTLSNPGVNKGVLPSRSLARPPEVQTGVLFDAQYSRIRTCGPKDLKAISGWREGRGSTGARRSDGSGSWTRLPPKRRHGIHHASCHASNTFRRSVGFNPVTRT